MKNLKQNSLDWSPVSELDTDKSYFFTEVAKRGIAKKDLLINKNLNVAKKSVPTKDLTVPNSFKFHINSGWSQLIPSE